MALAAIEKNHYPEDFNEMKQYIKIPYMEDVLQILKWEDTEDSRNMIYNTVRGHRKDYKILNAIRQHLGLRVRSFAPGVSPGSTLIKRQRLNPPK